MDTASTLNPQPPTVTAQSVTAKVILFQAQRALAKGHYDEAMIHLESAQPYVNPIQQAELQLHLAAVYALYRQRGLEGASLCLSEALQTQPSIVQNPLYQALMWQLAACRGETLASVRQGVVTALHSAQPLAQFHAATALIVAGGFRRATRILRLLTGLPEHLEWRRWSLLGEAHAKHGDWQSARDCFARSVQLCQGTDLQGELLSLIEALLYLSLPDDALTLFGTLQLSDDLLEDDLRSRKRYLQGLTATMLGQRHKGLEYFLMAYSQAVEANQLSFNLLFQLARAFASCEQFEQAAHVYERALEHCSSELRSVVLHAYGVTLAELGRLNQARTTLETVLEDNHYSHLDAVRADLAEICLQLHDIVRAYDLATEALSGSESAAACLCLGKLALEYFRSDEAVVWFERAISDAHEGDDIWIAAHVLLADTLAKQQFAMPERIHDSAKKALRYLPSYDDWTRVLESYMTRVLEQLGSSVRLVN
ncbi:MAG: tetratricopeptide repeat protein [Trueperaceae bacterium]